MDVRLDSWTYNPEITCAKAAKGCTNEEIPEELSFNDACNIVSRVLALGHLSIAEHASFTFHVSGISRITSHQLVRHRIASYAQQSQRYVNMSSMENVVPESFPDIVVAKFEALEQMAASFYKEATEIYNVPDEDARYGLLASGTTNIVITMNARELRTFFDLRCCSHSQWEIRKMAIKMLQCALAKAPALFEGKMVKCGTKGDCSKCKGGVPY